MALPTHIVLFEVGCSALRVNREHMHHRAALPIPVKRIHIVLLLWLFRFFRLLFLLLVEYSSETQSTVDSQHKADPLSSFQSGMTATPQTPLFTSTWMQMSPSRRETGYLVPSISGAMPWMSASLSNVSLLRRLIWQNHYA